MQIIKNLFKAIGSIFKFINTYFKTCIFLLILFLVFSSKAPQQANLVKLDINNVIMDNTELLSKIYEIKNDKNIKGVLLDIDSPGGSLSSSVALSDAIKELKQEKPVIAYASGTMASGSYYAAIWANKIYANRGSFIGSIGVIMEGADISELSAKLGIKTQTVKAGAYKEAGTFFRQWNAEEKQALQNLVDKSYEMFYSDVALARKIDVKTKDEWANARVFLADEAKKLGLIDGVYSFFQAKQELEKLANIDVAIWQETPVFDKFLDKIAKSSTDVIFKTLFLPHLK